MTVGGSLAQAQETADEAAARRAFRMGQAHYENGEFSEAASNFEEAYRLSHRVRLLYNAHVAYRDMQDIENAARTLRLFLSESSGDDLPATERDQLTARLAALDAAMARMGGGGSQQAADPQPQADPDPQPQADPDPQPTYEATGDGGSGASDDGGGGFNPSPVGFIVGGAGLALFITGIVVGAVSGSDLSTLESACPGDVCPDTPELRDAQSNGQTLALVGDILWATGAAAVAAGVILIFVLQEGGDDNATAGLSCTPDGCYGSVGGRF